jgi:hypothetical protein
MKAQLKKLWPPLAGATLAGLLAWFLATTNFGLGLVHFSYDFPFAFRETITPSEAVIIYLDEESGQRLEQPAGQPWNRALHAKLLQRLTADGAKSVTFDIYFADPSPADSVERQAGDALFAQEIARNGKVILGANVVTLGYDLDSLASGKRFDLPFETILTNAADVASVEMNPDQDLVVRNHLPYLDQIAPLAWATAEFVRSASTTNELSRRAALRSIITARLSRFPTCLFGGPSRPTARTGHPRPVSFMTNPFLSARNSRPSWPATQERIQDSYVLDRGVAIAPGRKPVHAWVKFTPRSFSTCCGATGSSAQ